MTSIAFSPIGTIHTPFTTQEGMPIQPSGGKGIQGYITINEEFIPGLTDLDGFSHIILLYHFHRSSDFNLQVTPFLDSKQHGVFATRAPKRPNAIGLSVVRLLSVKNNMIIIENVDMLDGTPLLDIKPYVPDFDLQDTIKTGWLQNKTDTLNEIKSDKRFNF